jgi:hypothetical protein
MDDQRVDQEGAGMLAAKEKRARTRRRVIGVASIALVLSILWAPPVLRVGNALLRDACTWFFLNVVLKLFGGMT